MQGSFERRTRDKLYRDLGPAIVAALQDERTVEVMLNPDGCLWHERLGEPMQCMGTMDVHRAEAVIKTLASHLDRVVTRDSPLLEGELPPDGLRFAGQIPPVVQAPAFSIRKPALKVLQLKHYEQRGALSAAQRAVLDRAVLLRRNVLVVGGTGSGKTTFVNALIAEMVQVSPRDRVVILEDTREIRCAAANSVQYRAGGAASMTDLLRASLRMRPDRILVGEVRGPEALDLLMAWNTGHAGGAATLHANDAHSALVRLEMLVSMHPRAPRNLQALVAAAVDLVVHVARTPTGHQVREIIEVVGVRGKAYAIRPMEANE